MYQSLYVLYTSHSGGKFLGRSALSWRRYDERKQLTRIPVATNDALNIGESGSMLILHFAEP